MPEQCCIGSRISKSVFNSVNWGRSNENNHCTKVQASEMIFNFPVESRQTHDALTLVHTKLKAKVNVMVHVGLEIPASSCINCVWILVASEHL